VVAVCFWGGLHTPITALGYEQQVPIPRGWDIVCWGMAVSHVQAERTLPVGWLHV